MFGDQIPSNIVWWSSMLMLKWVAKRFETCLIKHRWNNILVPRGRDPFGQHWKSRPLAQSNDIPVLNGFVNTIDWDQNQSDLSDLTQSMRRVTGSPWIADFRSWTRPEVVIFSADLKDRGLWGREWWNNWYYPLSKRGTHARIKHVWYTAVQTNKTSPIKHANKRNVLSSWSNVWRPSNFITHDQIRSNTIKQHQTRCPNGKLFGQQCLMVFGRQTFIVCPGPKFVLLLFNSCWSVRGSFAVFFTSSIKSFCKVQVAIVIIQPHFGCVQTWCPSWCLRTMLDGC